MTTDIETLLRLFESEENADLTWSVGQDGTLRFFVDCSDTFWWATADAEPVALPADLKSLAAARADTAAAAGGLAFWSILWVARQRQMRPMSRLLQGLEAKHPGFVRLLEATGPERDPQSEG